MRQGQIAYGLHTARKADIATSAQHDDGDQDKMFARGHGQPNVLTGSVSVSGRWLLAGDVAG